MNEAAPTHPQRRTNRIGDILAGITVALVLVPQALAYADLAGLPPYHGLYVAATVPIFAALFASSRYLQTGPVALTSLMTIGALLTRATPYTSEYIKLAALLALVVGATRLLIGLVHGGPLAYLMSRPVLHGFTVAAALLILGSQLPAVLGVDASRTNVVERATHALSHPGQWQLGAIILSAITMALMIWGRKMHPLFPGVLVGALIGIGASVIGLPVGPTIGSVPSGFPSIHADLPWQALPSLLIPGTMIALVGFAEATAISRAFATKDRERWDPDREFIGQGVANLAAGFFGGFPVGGSFSRSSLAREAGARTRWASAVSGVAVLLILPWVGILSALPKAVLGAIIFGAVMKLVRVVPFRDFWKQSRPQGTIAVITFASTLLAAPHVEYGVLAGVMASLTVHLWREMRLDVDHRYERGVLELKPMGVLWFGSAPALREEFGRQLAAYPNTERLLIELIGLGRVDLSGADVLRELVQDAQSAGLTVLFRNIPPHARRIMEPLFPEMNEVVDMSVLDAVLDQGFAISHSGTDPDQSEG